MSIITPISQSSSQQSDSIRVSHLQGKVSKAKSKIDTYQEKIEDKWQNLVSNLPIQKAKNQFDPSKLQKPQNKLLQDMQNNRQEFIELIQITKIKGYRYRPSRDIAVTTDGKALSYYDPLASTIEHYLTNHIPFHVFDQNALFLKDTHEKTNQQIDIGNMNPNEILLDVSAPLLQADAKLRPWLHRRVSTPSINLHLSLQGNSYRIVLWNWMEAKPVYDVTKDLSQMTQQEGIEWMKEIQDFIITEQFSLKPIRNGNSIHPTASQIKQISKDGSVYKVEQSKDIKFDEIEAQKALYELSLFTKMNFVTNSLDNDIDLLYKRIVFRDINKINLHMPRRILRRNQFKPLAVNGLVNYVYLSPRNNIFGDILRSENPQSKQVVDKYGNLIITVFDENNIFQGLVICPPFALSHNLSSNKKWIARGVDLTEFGLSDYPYFYSNNIIQQNEEIDSEKLNIYSAVNDELEPLVADSIPIIENKIKDTERMLGLEQGTVIDSVLFVKSYTPNATVSQSSHKTIVVWEEVLSSLFNKNGEFMVSHEFFHGLDAQFNLSDSSLFENFANNVIRSFSYGYYTYNDFLYLITDQNFADLEMGGHPWENKEEFFASLCNTLLVNDWRTKVLQYDDYTIQLYLEALEVLRLTLKESDIPNIELSEFYTRLNNRILELYSVPEDLHEKVAWAES